MFKENGIKIRVKDIKRLKSTGDTAVDNKNISHYENPISCFGGYRGIQPVSQY